ncbi:hypothetical protein GCM10028772_24940 [Nocardioides ultimimeridianus]
MLSRRPRIRTKAGKGIALLVIGVAVVTALAFKNDITIALRGGTTIHADFPQNYSLIKGQTRVKMAGLQVGVVSGVSQDPDGVTHVTMKVDDDVASELGSSPRAQIQPYTVLGGVYAVNLIPSADGTKFSGATIPQSRTSTPVELDRVLDALPDPTRRAVQDTVAELGDTLGARGAASLRRFSGTASRVLPPAGRLVTAAQGNHPATDLPTIVRGLQNLAANVDQRSGDLKASLTGLDRTTTTLAANSPELAQSINNLPAALMATRTGTRRLDGTLTRLGSTSTDLLPTANSLAPLVGKLTPTLRDALPAVRKLLPIVRDAQPLVRQLIPISQNADAIVRDIKGPVINKINGPILTTLGSTYRGTGAFKDTGGGVQADNKLYQEIGYMVTNLDRASQTQDAQGSTLNFQAGISAGLLKAGNLDLGDALAALLPQVVGR